MSLERLKLCHIPILFDRILYTHSTRASIVCRVIASSHSPRRSFAAKRLRRIGACSHRRSCHWRARVCTPHNPTQHSTHSFVHIQFALYYTQRHCFSSNQPTLAQLPIRYARRTTSERLRDFVAACECSPTKPTA